MSIVRWSVRRSVRIKRLEPLRPIVVKALKDREISAPFNGKLHQKEFEGHQTMGHLSLNPPYMALYHEKVHTSHEPDKF